MNDFDNATSIDYAPAFLASVTQILDEHPEGLGEYEFIQALKSQDYFPFLEPAPAPPHALFCAHFLLFNALYQLRDAEHGAQRAHIEISPLKIRRLFYAAGQQALGDCDPLREYYLDRSNLEQANEEQTHELIASFWRRLARRDHRDEALAALGLSDPVDAHTIRKTYKRLVMTHHPDRGGDHERLQSINNAVEVLLGTA